MFRLSIEWARLQPTPGEWSEDGFAFYDAVLDTLTANGIRPMLVLDQWVYPGWVADRGGWRNPAIVDDWLANAHRVVDRYADRDPLWITFVEPENYIKYEWRDGDLPTLEIPAMGQRIAQAHNTIYDHIHRVQPTAMVSVTIPFLAGAAEPIMNLPITDPVAERLDYIGISHYYTPTVQDLARNPFDLAQPGSWSVQPEDFYYALAFYARRYPGKPLFVAEAGLYDIDGKARSDGYDRADHLRDVVYWVQRARADGIDVLGFNYWSLTDSYEWGTYAMRFGLYTVDVRTDPTLTRRPTPVVDAYRAIIRASGVSADYRPTRAPLSCSLLDTPGSCTDPVTVPH
ncbi:family 1 glycosylhydrolase [Nocardia sp. NPDC059240]|uniref:family 1 glycosylhydrolase n=1 Tax=Nocardia sp. NPDC059240 TaxID=3346786 RepID=UPI0036AE7C40